jgi:Mg2+/Co2+ transporter CorB
LAKDGHAGARRAHQLLKRPDRLIGLILLGNNFVNILASAIATLLAVRLYGEDGVWVATALLTVVVLIFAEITPKTLAAMRPERFAFPATAILKPLAWLLSPLVLLFNTIPNALLRLFGISQEELTEHSISREELRCHAMKSLASIWTMSGSRSSNSCVTVSTPAYRSIVAK